MAVVTVISVQYFIDQGLMFLLFMIMVQIACSELQNNVHINNSYHLSVSVCMPIHLRLWTSPTYNRRAAVVSWLAHIYANPKVRGSGQIAYFHGVKTRLSTSGNGDVPRGSDST